MPEHKRRPKARGLWVAATLPALVVLVIAGALLVRNAGQSGSAARTAHVASLSQPVEAPPAVTPRVRSSSVLRPLDINGNWQLILNSEFTGRSLDSKLWRAGWFGSGVTAPINTHELACYSPENVSFPGDNSVHLSVTASRSVCGRRVHPYTGAVLSTNPRDGRSSGGFTFRYGVVQAKVYVPAAAHGIADWPAVLTLGQHWPEDGEDDIMENLGGIVCSHFHSPGYAPGGSLGACDPTFAPGWHIVSTNWEPGSVKWYYDGIEIAHFDKGVTSAPMYLVLVNTVSKKSPSITRPGAMRVAYVRVWQRPGPPPKSPGAPEKRK